MITDPVFEELCKKKELEMFVEQHNKRMTKEWEEKLRLREIEKAQRDEYIAALTRQLAP